jgi:hypothetical protein
MQPSRDCARGETIALRDRELGQPLGAGFDDRQVALVAGVPTALALDLPPVGPPGADLLAARHQLRPGLDLEPLGIVFDSLREITDQMESIGDL